jgi:hypothetical protein
MPERFADTPNIAGPYRLWTREFETRFPAEREKQQTKRRK